jgi:Rap1a immunity proteins
MMFYFFRSSILCLVCVGSLASTGVPQSATKSASHQESGPFFGGTGAELLKRCSAIGTIPEGDTVRSLQRADGVRDSNLCWGYIAGVVDQYQGIAMTVRTPQLFCLPPGVDLEQLEKVIRRGLEDNPAELHIQASVLIVNTLAGTFPCK